MITERITVADRRVDVVAAAKHAERALRRTDAGSGAGDASDREPTRRFSHVLARRIVLS